MKCKISVLNKNLATNILANNYGYAIMSYKHSRKAHLRIMMTVQNVSSRKEEQPSRPRFTSSTRLLSLYNVLRLPKRRA